MAQINEVFLSAGLVLVITIFFSYLAYKQKKDSWQGELIKKKSHTDDESCHTTYKLIFKTNEGKKKTITINSQQEFEKWQLADKAIKKSGEYFPQKF